MSEQTWFFVFWGFFLLLGLIEYRFSEPAVNVARSTRWPVNIGLGILNGAIFSLLPVSTVWIASWSATNNIGFFHLIDMPVWSIIVATVLIISLGQYTFHRLAHHIPALWAIHRVHHCDTYFDGSTGLRFHPLEFLANLLFIAPLVIVFGLDSITVATFSTFEFIYAIATHASVKLPLPIERVLRLIFITPGLHRLHHSDYVLETDNNYGAVFSFWDRIFGTYLAAPKREPHEFGFGIKDINPDQAANFSWLFQSPWRRLQPRSDHIVQNTAKK